MAGIHFSIASDVATHCETPEEVVLYLRACGWEYIQPSVAFGQMLVERGRTSWSHFRRWAESEGVHFEQGHLLNGIDLAASDRLKRQDDVEKVKRWCDLFEELGIIAGAVHPGTWESIFGSVPVEETLQYLAESLHELGEYTKGRHLRIALENCPDSVQSPETIVQMVNSSGCENIGFCFDTGHLNLTAADPGEYIRACGKKLFSLHLNDNSGLHFHGELKKGYWYPDDLHLFPGFFKQSVDWKKVISALHEIGYENAYNFEISLTAPNEQYRKAALQNAVSMAKTIFTPAGADSWWR
ncbi:MAG: Inosose isomerase [Lentisphaerae bacterium ADurb.Bin242]|nr:MAG: Inosose isomerase [Lentisphaerae bacterium ADurb.Bin242]